MTLIVDSFAGGGGASVGLESALGRPVDIAINHDADALAMHAANHPDTQHYQSDIWRVDPADMPGQVDVAWFSPDCTHHSKAKGGAPIRTPEQRMSRDLAWVVVRWAKRAKPRLIFLENVEEFADWAPLGEDGKPNRHRKGETFRSWVRALRSQGYNHIEWRELRACDYGVPTIRKRLYLVARRDGLPVMWPEPTHGTPDTPYRAAAECIDWHIPCPSIFLTREEAKAIGCRRPLAESTMRRIARGVWKYVINNPRPFIVLITHTKNGDMAHDIDEPLRTITTARGGEFSLVAPTLAPLTHQGSDRCGSVETPLPTVTGANRGEQSVVQAFLAQHNTGVVGRRADAPLSTVVGTGSHQQVVTAFMSRQFGNSIGSDATEPAHVVMPGGGGKTAVIAAHLSNQFSSNANGGNGELRDPMPAVLAGGQHRALVKAFLIKYYGAGTGQKLDEPCGTVTTKDRFGIVVLDGHDFEIADIGMRMLLPRELFRAQGFPESYDIEARGERNGKPLSKTMQVKMCGNSVCPGMAEAVVRANAINAGQRQLFSDHWKTAEQMEMRL